ncbi:hypothetical protein NSZ01_03320 [Nocardioides szechwanensis]|nr:hypothetical protein NSZ01_03320 [Nocardioides szechwanensis]
MFFSEDAISLENELHKAFADRRVNFVNERREFFSLPRRRCGRCCSRRSGLLEFSDDFEALEYHQSRGRWPNPV